MTDELKKSAQKSVGELNRDGPAPDYVPGDLDIINRQYIGPIKVTRKQFILLTEPAAPDLDTMVFKLDTLLMQLGQEPQEYKNSEDQLVEFSLTEEEGIYQARFNNRDYYICPDNQELFCNEIQFLYPGLITSLAGQLKGGLRKGDLSLMYAATPADKSKLFVSLETSLEDATKHFAQSLASVMVNTVGDLKELLLRVPDKTIKIDDLRIVASTRRPIKVDVSSGELITTVVDTEYTVSKRTDEIVMSCDLTVEKFYAMLEPFPDEAPVQSVRLKGSSNSVLIELMPNGLVVCD